MIKLATPISHLFEDRIAAGEIAALSDCLECREKSSRKEPRQYLFHFERDITHPWDDDEKKFLSSQIFSKKELRLASFHMSASCSGPILKDDVFYPGGVEFSRAEMLENARNNIAWLKSFVGEETEIAVENNNYYPTAAYRHITDPDFIYELVTENDIAFLFDIAHAKITTINKKESYADYVGRLPLDRTIQIHISKEGLNSRGWSCDSHDQPDESIFGEVKELVKKYPAEYLTIEYYKDKDNLLQLLREYRRLCIEPKKELV